MPGILEDLLGNPNVGVIPPEMRNVKENKNVLTSPYSSRLLQYFEEQEGDLALQHKLGYYRNGRFYPYKDVAGHWTIGYGNRIDDPKKYREGQTEKEAHSDLIKNITKAEKQAKRHFGKKGWNSMSRKQQEAAIDFAFNLGARGMKDFPKWSKALRRGDWEGVAKESKRYAKSSRTGRMVPLDKRNEAYVETFVNPNINEEVTSLF